MKTRAIVLLSGGLDSVTNFYAACADQNLQVVLALTMDYGQQASERELTVARWHARKMGVPHKILKTQLFKKYGSSALTHGQGQQIPQGTEVQIEDRLVSTASARAVWVPNRNGLFLNLAAFFAETMDAQKILIGFNQEEAQTFPDNSASFLQAANQFFSFSTRNQVEVHSYTLHWDKTQIVKQFLDYGDLATLWPCYHSGAQWCGQCESCQRFKKGVLNQQLNWENLLAANQTFIRQL